MLPNVIIPDTLTAIAPVIATTIAGWISQDNWPDYVNAIVAGLVILAVAALAVFVGGVQFTANVGADFVIVVAYCSALLYGPLRPLHKFLIVGAPGAIGTVAPAVRAEKEPGDPGQVTQATRPMGIPDAALRLPPGVVGAPTLRRHKAPTVPPPEPPTAP